jgi:hypothetical protein
MGNVINGSPYMFWSFVIFLNHMMSCAASWQMVAKIEGSFKSKQESK